MPEETSIQLSLTGISKRYTPSDWAVNQCQLHVYKGEHLSIVGPSGCGKTTLLRLIAGFESLDEGEIRINQQLLSSPAHHVVPEKRSIGFVFQEGALFPHLSVEDNIGFGMPELNRMPKKLRVLVTRIHKLYGYLFPQKMVPQQKAQQWVQHLLSMINLTAQAHHHPHTLSGGEQQRVALARALAPYPNLLLLDEPFSRLDIPLRRRLRTEVKTWLSKMGITTILVTHDQEEALAFGDRVAVMKQGCFSQVDTPQVLLTNPKNLSVVRFLEMDNLLPATRQKTGWQCDLGTFSQVQHAAGSDSNTTQGLLRLPFAALRPCEKEAGVSASIEDVSYFGVVPLYTLKLSSGQLIKATFALQPDKQLFIRVENDSPLILYPMLTETGSA